MLNLEKKLKFYEDQDFMAIEFKWYTPVAFFFLFFTIIWNAFLLFWYSMAFAGGAPIIFVLFPLIHVAVGLGLIYFTTCQFLNKTNIEIDDEYLSIRHSPIPWWRGNVEIPTDDINQLYVKEDKSQSKNGTSYTYSLRAKLKDNSDKEILSVTGVESTQMLEIEENLERFIGINDRPVKGEYQKDRTASNFVEPRRQRRDFTNSPLVNYYFLEKGALFNLKEAAVKVLSVTQFDWNDGNSDKLLQLSDKNGEEKLMYFDQNKAILDVFQEETLSLEDIGSITFQKNDPPQYFEIRGSLFRLSHYKKGLNFILGASQNIDVEQWIYLSKDKQTNIRVINNNGVIHYYKGTKLEVADFEDILDINAPPLPDIEYEEKPNWKDEDLV
jgi:hypothetical protein